MIEETNRKEATILFADIAGYTAMMAENESQALIHLESFKTTLETHLQSFEGKIMQFYGDGCLAVFPSPSNSIEFAKKIQSTFQDKYQLPVRIGIDAGWVVFKEGNVFGDAVNQASRIETICSPGGILFSKTISDSLKDNSDIIQKSIGSYQFKNVKNKMEVFGLASSNYPLPNREDILKNSKVITKNKSTSITTFFAFSIGLMALALLAFYVLKEDLTPLDLALKEKTIAVLPLKSIKTNQKSRLFADGILERVTKNLSQTKDIKTVTRSSVEKYRNSSLDLSNLAKELNVKLLLESNLTQSNNTIQLETKLIEFPDYEVRWSKNYKEKISLENLNKIQVDILNSLSKKLNFQIQPEVLEQILKTPTTNFQAYEAFLKAKEINVKYYFSKDLNDIDSAINFYKESIQLDESFAEGYAGLAHAYWLKNYDTYYFYRNFLDTALLLVDKALSINPYLPEAYQIKGSYFFEQSQFALAEQNFRRTLELQPNNHYCKTNLAFLVYYINGDYAEGLNLFKEVATIPKVDNLQEVYEKLAMLYLDVGDFENAESYFRKAKDIDPQSGGLGWAFHAQGKIEEFKDFYEELLQTFPNLNNQIPNLALGYMHLGDYNKSLEIWKPFIDDLDKQGGEHYLNRIRNRYGLTLWLAGRKQEALKQFELSNQYLNRSVQLDRLLASGGAAQYDLAGNAAFLGKNEEAYRWLDEFGKYGWKWGSIHFINVDPLFNNIRNESKFKSIINKVLLKKKKINNDLAAGEVE